MVDCNGRRHNKLGQFESDAGSKVDAVIRTMRQRIPCLQYKKQEDGSIAVKLPAKYEQVTIDSMNKYLYKRYGFRSEGFGRAVEGYKYATYKKGD